MIESLIKLELMKLGYRFHNNDLPKKIIELIKTGWKNRSLIKRHTYNTRNKHSQIDQINVAVHRQLSVSM